MKQKPLLTEADRRLSIALGRRAMVRVRLDDGRTIEFLPCTVDVSPEAGVMWFGVTSGRTDSEIVGFGSFQIEGAEILDPAEEPSAAAASDPLQYRSGLKEGDCLMLREPLQCTDADGRPTERFESGSMWIVQRPLGGDIDIVILTNPKGEMHTWDDASITVDFVRL